MSHSVTGWPLGSRSRVCLFALLLAVVTIFSYRPAWNGGFIWDDNKYVANNELLTAPDGLRRIWFSLDSPSQYFPLVYTTFRIEHALWGLNPSGYHWVNILLHVANALLVWRLLARLNVPGAWLAGAIFALHPVQVESVAWITERKNVLMGFFFLLTLLAWTVFIDEQTKRPWRFYGLALVLYGLALSAKSTACTLPAALLLILWLQRKQINWRRIFQIVPFFLLGLGMGLVAVWWECYHQGTRGALFALSPVERILIASRAVWFYLGKLIWPSTLTFIYPRWTISPTHLLDYAWLLAAGALCALIYFARRYVGRSVEVATVFFVATLSPVLGLIMLYTFRYTFVADHYQYLASIGPIALVSAGVASLAGTFERSRPLIFGTAVVMVATLAVLTWRQSAMYADLEGLWRTTLARNPGCWMAQINLGAALSQKGEIDEAIAHYRAALQLQPDFTYADFNLGMGLLQKGEIDEAISYLEEALKISPSYATHEGLGAGLLRRGEIREAILHFEAAVNLQSNDAEGHGNLAAALIRDGRVDEAISHWQESLKIRPGNAEIQNYLAAALLQKGEVKEAAAHWKRSLELQPNNADTINNLGIAISQEGRISEAIVLWDKALALQPNNVNALSNLAWVLATSPETSIRDGAKAIEYAQKLLQLSGGTNPRVFRTLAAAYAESGRFSEAIDTAQRGWELATAQGNSTLADELERNVALYRANSPLRDIPQAEPSP
jgi:tetratricopeptide (TPR) repeat protein